MKDDETRKTKQNNKTAILEKLKESIMGEEVDSKGVEDLSKNVDNPDGAVELIGESKKNYEEQEKYYFNASLSTRYKF